MCANKQSNVARWSALYRYTCKHATCDLHGNTKERVCHCYIPKYWSSENSDVHILRNISFNTNYGNYFNVILRTLIFHGAGCVGWLYNIYTVCNSACEVVTIRASTLTYNNIKMDEWIAVITNVKYQCENATPVKCFCLIHLFKAMFLTVVIAGINWISNF